MEENHTENHNSNFGKELDKDTHSEEPILTPMKSKIGLVLLCMVMGMLGGIYGSLNLANKPAIQKLFSGITSHQTNTVNQNLVLNEESAITKVVKDSSPAVVSIIVSKEVVKNQNIFDPFGIFSNNQPPADNKTGTLQEVAAGTGFFVSDDGLILTNKHVVSDTAATYRVVTNDGQSYEAKVLSRDPVNDLAIVKVEAHGMKYLTFADSTKIELGEHVLAIGNSLGQYQNTVTSGIVSGIGRSIVAGDRTGSEQLEGVIQTDAAINPGNSGGPLLDLAGQVIGINSAIDQQGQSVGFAIPSNDVKVALDSYQKNGKIVRPYLGVRYVLITDAIAAEDKLPRKTGALIIDGRRSADPAVLPGSPADKAGIKSGDIIISIEGKEINQDSSLSKLLRSFKAGDTVSLRILRDGNEQTLKVTLGEAQ